MDEPILALPWRSTDARALVFAGHTITLEEGGLSDARGDDDTVGFILWDGSAHLARWLVENAMLVRGKRVLELGAGVGLVSIVAAHLGASSCCATDQAHVVPPLARNVAANGVSHVVRTLPFKWGIDPPPLVDADVVLAADCVYSPQLAPIFARALSQCLMPTASAIIASKVRSVALMRALEDEFIAHGCRWETLTGDAELVEYVIHRVRRA